MGLILFLPEQLNNEQQTTNEEIAKYNNSDNTGNRPAVRWALPVRIRLPYRNSTEENGV